MIFRPTYRQENRLRKSGYVNIAGADEAGRGAWAGPVVAAAVVLPPGLKVVGINDSKLLSRARREKIFAYITKRALSFGVGVVAEKEIDAKGIIGATRKALLKAIGQLGAEVDYLLVDGIKIFEHSLPTRFIVKGDRRVVSIAAASIIAKIIRDTLMDKAHSQYPEYGFAEHKGYGTKKHQDCLDKYGVCDIHRVSYQPISARILSKIRRQNKDQFD